MLGVIYYLYSVLTCLSSRFYKEALKEPCKATLDNGNLCKGDPVYRKFKKQSHFGKLGFIGCSDWIRGTKGSHRFLPIPKDVKEELVVELFESENGSFASRELSTKLCAWVLHPCNGAKGYQECGKYLLI